MKPVAILTADKNMDYLFVLPIVAKSWELQGFETDIVVISDHVGKLRSVLDNYLTNRISIFPGDEKIKSRLNPAIYTQCLRLYIGRTHQPGTYCILGDADMFIASSFLYRDFDKVNVFGHDLTGYGEVPMCYVGMNSEKWAEVFSRQMIEDIQEYATPHSDEWHKAWGCDQQILTGKLKEYGFEKINFIDRQIDKNNSNLPLGRWDRYNWVKPSGEIHDVHLMRDPIKEENFFMIKNVCNTIYPAENWQWLDEYREKFITELYEPARIPG